MKDLVMMIENDKKELIEIKPFSSINMNFLIKTSSPLQKNNFAENYSINMEYDFQFEYFFSLILILSRKKTENYLNKELTINMEAAWFNHIDEDYIKKKKI